MAVAVSSPTSQVLFAGSSSTHPVIVLSPSTLFVNVNVASSAASVKSSPLAGRGVPSPVTAKWTSAPASGSAELIEDGCRHVVVGTEVVGFGRRSEGDVVSYPHFPRLLAVPLSSPMSQSVPASASTHVVIVFVPALAFVKVNVACPAASVHRHRPLARA